MPSPPDCAGTATITTSVNRGSGSLDLQPVEQVASRRSDGVDGTVEYLGVSGGR